MKITVHVRYFAAAADTAGTDEERITLPLPATIEDLREHVVSRHGSNLGRVLNLCSFLLNGRAAELSQTLATDGEPEVRVDVLPPFAGG